MTEAKAGIEARARQLLEAWLRGMNQGGHLVTPDDIREVYETALQSARYEAKASK